MKTVACFLLVFITTFSLTACYKEVKIENSLVTVKPVINCLFNEDSIWKVNVSLTEGTDSAAITYVNNAIVKISSPNGFSEQLIYSTNGNYISPNNTKPVKEISYTLEVTVPGFGKLTATDAIPAALQTGAVNFDTNIVTMTPYLFSDPVKTYPVSIIFNDPEAAAKYYMLRPLYYDKEELKIFKVSQAALDSLSKYKLFFNKNDSIKFTSILNQEYKGRSNFGKALAQISTAYMYTEKVYQYAYAGNFTVHYNELFLNQRAYVKDATFSNLADDYYSVFGAKATGTILNNYKLGLFYNANAGEAFTYVNGELVKKEVEWYIEVNTLSEAAYKYYSTYLQNIANRNHPFAGQINVFSNVKNGVGIFAGIHTNRIKIR